MRSTHSRQANHALATALAALLVAPCAARAQSAGTYEVTPELIAAAEKEGKVVWYTSADTEVVERLANDFHAKYPKIEVSTERSGAERNFQRINQEYGSDLHVVDIYEASDAVQFPIFKRAGWLAKSLPAEVVKLWPKNGVDPDGEFATARANLSVIAYNTKFIKPADAPTSLASLLDPKWRGKMVKAHPGYSGTIMTATYVISHALGWDYFEKLGHQRVMQVQSSSDPPKKLALGERPVMADGNEYNIHILAEKGVPVVPVYAPEGTPFVPGNAAILKDAPHPNAAKLYFAYIYSLEGQQGLSDVGGLRSLHPGVKEKAGRVPLSQIKLLESDPVALEKEIETIKQKYEQYFGT